MGRVKYRSKVRICADILSVILREGEVGPTKIMYGANLSYDRLGKYLNYLLELGLIEEVKRGDRTTYVLTERGFRFLEEFRRFERFSRAFGIEI